MTNVDSASPHASGSQVEHAGMQGHRQEAHDRLLDGQNRALRLLARGGALEQVLETLVRGAEAAAPGVFASILLLDDGRLKHGAAPSLPTWYCEAIDGVQVGPAVGSCGTAVHLRQRVVVVDIQTDPLWYAYRDLAARAGLRACWSEPIFASDGTCLGSFGMYYASPRAPSQDDLDFIENAAQVAGIAIERRRSETLLQEAMQRAERASQAKTAFLAHMSHELRTPLNAIIGFADIVDSGMFGAVGERNQGYVRDIAASGRHLLDIVAGLLELSRVEGSAVTAESVDLDALTADIAENFAVRIEQKRLVFSRRIGPDARWVVSDAGALRQLLTNLLDNAVNYTPVGRAVELEVVCSGDQDRDRGEIRVRIVDTGPGIDTSRLPHVREAFHGCGELTSRTGSGMGIGLAIADRLARMIGATLDIESRPDEGTCVTLRLPQAPGGGLTGPSVAMLWPSDGSC